MVLLVPACAVCNCVWSVIIFSIFSFWMTVLVGPSPEGIICSSCRIHIWMKHGRFTLRFMWIKRSKEKLFIQYIKSEHQGWPGQSLLRKNHTLSMFLVQNIPGPTVRHSSICFIIQYSLTPYSRTVFITFIAAAQTLPRKWFNWMPNLKETPHILQILWKICFCNELLSCPQVPLSLKRRLPLEMTG